MRTVLRILGWVVGVLVLAPIFVVLAAILLLNIDPGRRLVERLAGQLTGGQIEIAGLAGRFPDALRLGHAEVRDAKGAWLTLDDVALDWSPLALLHKEARVEMLSAGRIVVARLPETAPSASTASPASNEPFSLPVRVSVEAIHVRRAEIGKPVAGVAAVVALDGKAHLASLEDGDADVTIDRLDSPGSYEVHGTIDPTHLAARLRVAEPPKGLIAAIAKLPDIGAIGLTASVDGPRTAEATALELAAGPLHATAKGVVDIAGQSADLDVVANAPAMTPAPGVSWQSVALDAHVHGPFTKPDATGTLRLSGLAAGGAQIATLSADLSGNQGAAALRATVEGLRIPGPKPDLLAGAPLVLQADARLDTPARPLNFTLTHPLLQAKGTANTGGDITAHVDLTAPDLKPLAAVGGVDLQGRTQLAVDATMAGGTTNVTVDGTLGITGGMAPVPGLVGDAAKLGVTVAMTGSDITISRAQLAGRTLSLDASGTDKAGALDVRYKVGLSNLAVLAASIEGALTVEGTAKGPTDDLTVAANVAGDIGTKGVPRGPVKVSLNATGLPGKPAGAVVAQGTLEGAPLNLSLHADRSADGVLRATIEKADWKSLHAEGGVTMAPGATLPDGKVSLRMTRLEDLRALVGQAVSGSVTAVADMQGGVAKLDLTALRAGIPGSSVGRAVLAARVTDPTTRPVVAATLNADGIEASGMGGTAKLAVNGPQDALAIKLNAALSNVAGANATVDTAATLNATARTVQLAALTADWKGQTIRLLAPARVSFGDGVAVDRLRIGLQQAVLELAGRVTPALNLTASLRGVTPDLAKPFAPAVDATGEISADAKLTGTPAAPSGTVRLTATGLHMRSGQARALPPANITATAQLAGQSATVDARLSAGRSNLAVTGRVPVGAGALAVRATGGVDLAMLDPILAPDGRRARGQVSLDAGVNGTVAAPQVSGTVTLANGEVQDFGQGVRVTALAATIQGSGQTIRIASLTGKAGNGTISASGTVGLQGAMPVDIALTMRNARPLASERLTADLDADLAVRGDVEGMLSASGKIAIRQANINIPEHLPVSVAVLPVRIAGVPPPAPPKPGPVIRLDLQLDTPGQIFVRGRGMDAVLGGGLHVGGTTAAPQIIGGFDMRRGTFSLAGTTLTFARGKVSFVGAGVTNKIDPSLDFEADSATSTGTAMLIVSGYASAPKITLSSSPPSPQDEVLAQLLFGRSTKELGPFQYAEIAAALADLSGTTSGASNPLEGVRKGLGLDRLSVGGGASGGSGGSSAATIEAGKYVANGVYVGAKQGTTGANTQATVQIDIYKGLKAETDVGTGAGGNSVGLSYQFEY
ncbi:translocation/assembly module TamB domain-containing protein [Acidisphaera sp. L21]|uniref:translocation/assembly module TamB domain-containing protein n=1 Tax=Acidisphaera sp. L21 TaxID=1641851 RepID=UPI00131ECACB|nr:translocation/assembly module TamB domain-containing protein [Acidisphaera sp. L21]